jgi:hypothetical protein
MMPRVREVGYLAEKWSRKAGQAAPDYEFGVRNPTTDWQQATLQARDAWRAGIQQAIQENRWENAIRQTSTQQWAEAAATKGPQRYSQGVQLARDKWAREWEPYRQVIESVQLPPRGPRGDPNNIQRVAKIAQELHNARRRRTGGGR